MNAVVTFIFGENKELLHEPKVVDPDVEYICVTDNLQLRSKIWKMVISPLTEYASVRLKIAYVKTHAFEYVSKNCDKVCIIDGSISIERSIKSLFTKCNDCIMLKPHPVRHNLIDEIHAWIKQRNLSEICVQRYKTLASAMKANLNCGPLYETSVMVWCRNELNETFGKAVFNAMIRMSDDKHVFLSNQLVMSLFLQSVFRDLPVTLINQGDYFIKHGHNSTKIKQPLNPISSQCKPSTNKSRKIIDNITMLSAHFNTPGLLLFMMNSLVFQLHRPIPMCIIDNSTSIPLPIDVMQNKWLNVIDNTNYKITPNFGQCSANHAASIEYAMNTITTKYVMLCDTDILFFPSIRELLNQPVNAFDACGEVGWSTHPGDRLYPYFCIIDLEKKRHDGISFFDPNRIMVDCMGVPFNTTHRTIKDDMAYFDTGASFLQDILFHKWNIEHILLDEYINHKKGGTLHPNNNLTIDEWLYANRNLFNVEWL